MTENYQLLTLAEAAELSGVHVKRIKDAIALKQLRVVQFGPKSRKVLLSELHRWWQSCQIEHTT